MAKNKEKKKKHSVILLVCFMMTVCYLLLSFFTLQKELKREKQELAQLQAQVQEQEAQNDVLKREIENEDDRELIERIAREELGYVYPNEQIYAKSPAGAIPGQ